MNESQTHLVLHIRRNLLKMFTFSFIIALIVYTGMVLFPQKHTSEIQIYNTGFVYDIYADFNPYTPSKVLENPNNTTLISWVYSSKLLNHLIKIFNLQKHYKISDSEPNAYIKSFNKLTSSIHVEQTTYNAICIRVEDYDRFMAARIANEIIFKIQKLNTELILSKKKFLIEQYSAMSRKFEKLYNSKIDSLNNLLIKFKELFITPINNEKISLKLASSQELIIQTIEDFGASSKSLLEANKMEEWSKNYIENHKLPEALIMKYALPSDKISPLNFNNILTGVWTFILSFFLSLFFVAYTFRYKSTINILIKGFSNNTLNNDTSLVLSNTEKVITTEK